MNTPRDAAAPPTPPAWAARRERGNLLALRFMAWLAVTAGRPVARLLLPPITLYFLLFGREARRHSRRYLGRVLGRPVTWRDQYLHFHAFASTVLDRVYFVRNQLDAFDLTMTGDAAAEDTINDRQAGTASGQHGGFLLGAHVGSFESLHAAGKSYPGMRVTMVMYPDNARKIHGVLQAMAPDFKLAVIAIGNPGSTLAIRDALDAGRLVGLLGDRYRGAESVRTPAIPLPFLGQPANFSDGPLRLAMLLKRRVLFMVGLFLGGRRYDVRFETLADFRNPPADPAAREALIQHALADYVARLENLCREAPYNWFNFYDYWHEDHAH
jgi:predicted LPLAT superfamily acyltransferase